MDVAGVLRSQLLTSVPIPSASLTCQRANACMTPTRAIRTAMPLTTRAAEVGSASSPPRAEEDRRTGGAFRDPSRREPREPRRRSGEPHEDEGEATTDDDPGEGTWKAH